MYKLLLTLFILEYVHGQYHNFGVNIQVPTLDNVFSKIRDVTGNRCLLDNNNGRGVCRPSHQCQVVFDLLKCNGIKPTTCRFRGNTPFVCCPNDNIRPRNCNTATVTPPFVTPPVVAPPVDIPNTHSLKRISAQKCDEYRKCKNLFKPAIVGGVDADEEEFPHMAAIGWRYADGSGIAWNCGGSLISEHFVITAAHCSDNGRDSTLASPQPTLVRLGAQNLKDSDTTYIQDIPIAAIINHPEYKSPIKYHDIALIRLASPARLTDSVRPTCLWQSNQFPSENSIASGWGALGFGQSTSDILQKVDLKIIRHDMCPTYYSKPNRKLPRGIIDSQLCAGELKGGKDTCQGDSGGPLQITDPGIPCTHHLVGLTSFGVGCGGANAPAVYTRVSSYIDWIESIVWP